MATKVKAKSIATVNQRRFPVDLQVTVVFTREARLRLWLAAQLMRLSAFVLGGRANVDINGENASEYGS